MEIDKVYNEDCLEVLKRLPNESIDLIVTDCPYHIVSGGCTTIPRADEPRGIFNRRSAFTQENSKSGKLFDYNDIEFSEWLPDVYRVLKNNSHIYIMINGRNLKDLQIECEKVGFEFQQLLVWYKDNATPNRYYLNACEFILMCRKGNAKSINNMGAKNVIQLSNIQGKKTHPTEKPTNLMKIFIENSSEVGDIVMDPFAGSGSTLEACKQCGRHYIGCEIDTKYYEEIMYRLEGVMTESIKNTKNIRLW